MTHTETIAAVESRMSRSSQRYGIFASTHEALGVALEEWDELRLAVQANDLQAVAHEALDLAAVCIRLSIACDRDEFAARSVK